MTLMCQDCVELDLKLKQKAEIVLFPSWQWPVKLLCQDHFDEYAYAEGEFNLEYCSLDDRWAFFRQLNEILEYREKKHLSLLDLWSEQKKEIQSLSESAKKEVE